MKYILSTSVYRFTIDTRRITRAESAPLLHVRLFAPGAAMRYSTGAVRDYSAVCGSTDLPLTIPEAEAFRTWYSLAGFDLFSRWENGDVWGSDFRDANGGDLEPNGGSDVPDIYFYTGHGTCQNPPAATDPDFISVCGNFGAPNRTKVCRWDSRP